MTYVPSSDNDTEIAAFPPPEPVDVSRLVLFIWRFLIEPHESRTHPA